MKELLKQLEKDVRLRESIASSLSFSEHLKSATKSDETRRIINLIKRRLEKK